MKRYKLVVMARPTEGMEQEFNDWYQQQHLPDVTAVAGFRSAQRFKLVKVMSKHDAYPYLSIYDIETDDIEAALSDMKSRARTERMPISEALAPGSFGVVYEEAGPAVFAIDI